MNYKFLNHIFKNEKKSEQPIFSNKEFLRIKKNLKENKIFTTKRIITAFYTLSVYRDAKTNSKGDLKKEFIKIYSLTYSVFLLLIVFFELISLALAFGNGINTNFIIFLSIIGFVFAYAVFSITLDPILYLLIQKKIAEMK
jgi:hypothetical protein